MGDVQLVINISEEVYKHIMNLKDTIWLPDAPAIAKSISEGVVLPEHGRCIDISPYEEYFNTAITYDDGNHIHEVYTNAISTILEASKK